MSNANRFSKAIELKKMQNEKINLNKIDKLNDKNIENMNLKLK